MYFQFHHQDFPKVSFMDKFQSPPGWIHDKRTPGEYIIFIMKSGILYLREEENTYTLQPGDLLLLEPYKEHAGTQISNAEYYFIHFPASFLEFVPSDGELLERLKKTHTLQNQTPSHAYTLYQDAPLVLPKHFHFSDTAAFRKVCSLMEYAGQSARCCQNHFKTISSCCFLDILIQISSDFTRQLLSDSQKSFTQAQLGVIHHMMSFLQEHYKEKITRIEIEKVFEMSFDYLNRLFKRYTGLTIFAYQKNIRLNHAADLVASGKYKSYEIAEMIGIPDVYYFSKVFKEQFGVSPRNYLRTEI